jgi:hypothetical protein
MPNGCFYYLWSKIDNYFYFNDFGVTTGAPATQT